MRILLFLLLLLAGSALAEAPRIPPGDLEALVKAGEVVFLDVREPSEIEESGTLEGAIRIPIGELEARLDELPRDKPILAA